MAENVVLNSGSGGATLAADEITGVHHQRVKVQHGADGSATDVSTASPLPVDLRADNLAGNLDVAITASTATVTVDGSGVTQPISHSALDLIHSEDYDTDAGTDNTAAVGLVVPSTTGAVAVTGDAANGLDVDVTRVSGTVTVDGSGVTQPISAASLPLPTGAATSANQSTANSSLATIAGAVAGTEMQVDVLTSVLPTGASTAANQSTGNTSLGNIDTNTTDVPNVIGTDGAVGPAKALSVAGTESGGTLQELRVDADGHLQIDVLSGGGGGTQYTEDAAAPADPVGTAVALVRDDTPVSIAADGDIVAQRATQYGAAYTQIVSSTGSFVDSFGGGTQYTEGNTDASITGTAMLMEGAADTLVVAQGTAADGLLVNLGSNNDVTVTGTVTANAGTGTLSVDSELPAAAALADAAANPTTPTVGAAALGWNGATWDRLVSSTANGLEADVTRVQGTVTVDGSAVTQPISHSALDLIHSEDYDTDAGTDNTAAVGLVVPSTTGAVAVTGDTANGLDVDVTRVSGTVTVDGSAVTQPISAATLPLPSGASTAANQSTANTSLSNIETAVQVIDNAIFADDAAFTLGSSSVEVAGAIRDDSLTTLTAVEGDAVPLRVSATGALHVTGGGGGTEYVEDAAAPADPTGTVAVFVRDDAPVSHAADGDWVAQRGTQYGAGCVQIVSSTGSFVDTFGGGTQYTEDDAAAANPVGTTPVLVRQDTPATLTSTDGDVVAQRATNYGAAFVQILDSSGNFINTFGGSGGTSHADDAAFTIGSASSITPAGYLADETTPDSVDEGDVGVPRMTLNRKAYAVLADPTAENSAGVDASGHLQVDIAADSAGLATQATLATVETNTDYGTVTGGGVEASALRVTLASDSTGQITVDGTVTANAGTGTMTVDSELPAAAALADAAANPTTPTVGAAALGWNGATWDRLTSTTANGLDVDVTRVQGTVTVASHDVTNAGTFATQVDGAALTALQLIDDSVFADDAAFTLTSSKVNMSGAIVDASLSALAAAEGDAVPLRVNGNGALHVTGGGGGTEYTEDAVFSSAIGGAQLMVRDDAPVTVGADGDWVARRSTAYGAAYTQIVDSTGSFVDSFGGGVQYTEAATDASITGTALMFEDAADTLRAATGNVANGLDVDVTRVQGTVTVASHDVTNAGTFATQVDGAALTALQLIDDIVYTDDTDTHATGASKGALMMAAATPTDGSVEANDIGAVAMSTDRRLLTDAQIVGQDANLTVDLGVTDNAVLDQIELNTSYGDNVGNGTAAGSLRVTMASDSTGTVATTNAGTFVVQENGAALTALQLIDDIVYTDDTDTHATGSSKGALIMAAADPTDTLVAANDIGAVAMTTDRYLQTQNRVEGQADSIVGDGGSTITGAPGNLVYNGSTWDRMRGDTTNGVDVDVTRIAAGTNLVGDVGLSGARTSGGTTLYKNIDVDETEDQIKGTAGQVYWIHAMNLASSTRFLKLYNATAATVVVGTTTPDLTFPLATQGDTNGAGFTLSIPNGIAFGTAITVAATTGVADNDNGAPGANEVIVNLGYA